MTKMRAKNPKTTYDPNFKTVLQWIRQLKKEYKDKIMPYGSSPVGFFGNGFPEGARKVAELVNLIDYPLIQEQEIRKLNKVGRDARIINIVKLARKRENYYWIGSIHPDVELGILLLALWYGCLTSAKLVAYQTHSGINTVKYRRERMPVIDKRLEKLKKLSPGFIQGFIAGPYFRMLRGQGVYFFGIPKKYMEKYGFDDIEKTL